MANITTQTIRVDLSTDKVIPSAFTHQNDTARTLVFDMYNGGMPYTMTGNTVKFAYKSPIVNGQYSVIAGASMASGTVSGNKVTVTLPSAYTAISGVGMLTMIITPASGTVRPVNIRLVVQKSADGDDTVLGASDWPAGLYDYMDDWLAENEPTEIANLKSELNYLFEDEQLINARYIAANNNTALVNNNDGTYTIGTTDFGNTTFGGLTTLKPGDYYLFGVPNGIAYLSTVGTSQSYENRVFENTSNIPKKIHIDTEQQLWVCFRSPSKPSSAYTISPSLYYYKPKVNDALKFMGVLESNTDLNYVLDAGIYLLSSDRSYTNAPLTSGYLFVLSTVTAVQQICIQYGSGLMYVGAIYKRDGSNTGVTADWHRLGRLFNHNIAFFGDSIMWGRDGSASASTRTKWQIPVIVHETLSVSVVNYGVSGQGFLPNGSTSTTAYSNISSKTLTNFDTLVMCYGVNDGFNPLGDWDSTDESTIMGQFNKIINYIYTQNPTMRVIVFAPFNGTNVGTYPDYWYGDRNNPPYVSRKVLSDTLKRACDYYWIPYIEQYDSPLNAKTITQLLPDGTHPNDEGYKMIGEWFAGKIRGLL